jgi:hypothetical protein
MKKKNDFALQIFEYSGTRDGTEVKRSPEQFKHQQLQNWRRSYTETVEKGST